MASTYKKYIGFINLFCCIAATAAVIVIVIAPFLILHGRHLVDDGKYLNNFKDVATLEECLVTGTNTTRCETDERGIFSTIYEYNAIALEKCGNGIILKSIYKENEYLCSKEYKPKEINNYYDCYVSECEDKQFAFYSEDDMVDKGNDLVIKWSVAAGISVLILALTVWHVKWSCANACH
eukprot:395131_1